MTELTPEEADLLADLRTALAEADAVPDDARQAARGAFLWREIDAFLMSVTYDSVDSPVLVRGDSPERRTLAFEAADISLDLEIGDVALNGQLTGQLVGTGACVVTVYAASGGFAATEADEDGFFTVDWTEHGPTRIGIDVSGQKLLTTWVVL